MIIIKSSEEIEIIRKAGKIVKQGEVMSTIKQYEEFMKE